MVFIRTDKKCMPQNRSSESSTLIRMRRSSVSIIPWAVATVTEHLCRLIPRPQFNQTVKPKIQMKGSNVTAEGPHLLLTGSFNFLKITKVLLNDISVSKAGMDLLTLFSKFGDKIVFYGGVDIRTLISNDKTQIDEELKKKIPPVVSGGGGYKLHTDHSEPLEVDYETEHYFVDRARQIAAASVRAIG